VTFSDECLHGWQSEKPLIIITGAKAILCGCNKQIIHEMNHSMVWVVQWWAAALYFFPKNVNQDS